MPKIINLESLMPAGASPFATRRVFFTGTTAVLKGQAVVFDINPPSTAPAVGQCVKTPTSVYKRWFAGVARQSYAANANGQWIEIITEGVAECLVGPAVSIGDIVTFTQTGKFGLRVNATSEASGSSPAVITQTGYGTAIALEANDTASSAGKLVKCLLEDGDSCVAPDYRYQ